MEVSTANRNNFHTNVMELPFSQCGINLSVQLELLVRLCWSHGVSSPYQCIFSGWPLVTNQGIFCTMPWCCFHFFIMFRIGLPFVQTLHKRASFSCSIPYMFMMLIEGFFSVHHWEILPELIFDKILILRKTCFFSVSLIWSFHIFLPTPHGIIVGRIK